jgi:hypothetical protein
VDSLREFDDQAFGAADVAEEEGVLVTTLDGSFATMKSRARGQASSR